jgi:hypothetical protein
VALSEVCQRSEPPVESHFSLKSRKNRLFLLFCLVKISLADGSEIAEKGYFFCFLRLKNLKKGHAGGAVKKKKKSAPPRPQSDDEKM